METALLYLHQTALLYLHQTTGYWLSSALYELALLLGHLKILWPHQTRKHVVVWGLVVLASSAQSRRHRTSS